MLESLRKKLSFNTTGSSPDEVSMSTFETTQALATQLQEAIDNIQQLNSAVAEKEGAIASLLSKVESVTASYEAAKEQLKTFQEAQAQASEKSRKEALAAVMGTENPELEAEFAILKGLDEAAFQIVVKSKAAAAEAIEKSAMFKEIGVAGEAEVVDQPTESAEMRVLKQKYQPK